MNAHFGVRTTTEGFTCEYSEWLTAHDAADTAKALANEYPESEFEAFDRETGERI